MTTFKMLAAGLTLCLVALGARAEEKADNAKLIVGKWEVAKAEEGTLPNGTIDEFSKDGKLKLSGSDEFKIDGTYKVDGDKFTITMKIGDQEQSHTITIKKLTKTELHTTDKDGKVVELKRKK